MAILKPVFRQRGSIAGRLRGAQSEGFWESRSGWRKTASDSTAVPSVPNCRPCAIYAYSESSATCGSLCSPSLGTYVALRPSEPPRPLPPSPRVPPPSCTLFRDWLGQSPTSATSNLGLVAVILLPIPVNMALLSPPFGPISHSNSTLRLLFYGQPCLGLFCLV